MAISHFDLESQITAVPPAYIINRINDSQNNEELPAYTPPKPVPARKTRESWKSYFWVLVIILGSVIGLSTTFARVENPANKFDYEICACQTKFNARTKELSGKALCKVFTENQVQVEINHVYSDEEYDMYMQRYKNGLDLQTCFVDFTGKAPIKVHYGIDYFIFNESLWTAGMVIAIVGITGLVASR